MGNISYRPIVSTTAAVTTLSLATNIYAFDPLSDMSRAIATGFTWAIEEAFVKPIQKFLVGIWYWFVDVSIPACSTITLLALILALCGSKKAKRWIIPPAIVAVIIQLANLMLTGGVK